MKIITQLTIFACILFYQTIFAETVWVQQPGVMAAEIDLVRDINKSEMSFAEHTKQRIHKDHQQFIKNQFIHIQKVYLSQPKNKVIEEFKKFINFRFKSDWNDKYRALFNYAFLRLAEIDQNQQSWMEMSFQFDPLWSPDPSVFAPPISQAYNQLKSIQHKSLRSQVLPQTEFLQFVLINGRVFKPSDVQMPKGQFRLTVLSNQFQIFSKIMSQDEISKIQFKPLTKERCPTQMNYQIKADINLKIQKNSNCQKSQITLATLQPKPSFSLPLPQNKVNTISTYQPKPFYKSKWFWLSSAAITGAIFVYQNMNKKSENSNTQTSHKRNL